MSAADELEKDFREALSHVDVMKYDPYSREFMKALFIGQMFMCVKSLGESEESDIEEEIDGAKKYLAMYKSTSDMAYHDMAADELRHAGILVKKALLKNPSAEEKKNLQHVEEKIKEITLQM